MSAAARILVIDDEAPIRRFLRIAREGEGHGVIVAATAETGSPPWPARSRRW